MGGDSPACAQGRSAPGKASGGALSPGAGKLCCAVAVLPPAMRPWRLAGSAPGIAFALLAALLLAVAPAAALPPPERLAVLQRGVNLTNWFRFPARADPASLRAYLDPAALAALRRARFGFVRLAVQPELLEDGQSEAAGRLAALDDAVLRLQAAGLGVVLTPHPRDWRPEASVSERARLLRFWRRLAPLLVRHDPRLTFAELVNEPVFHGDPAGWAALQAGLAASVRALLPRTTLLVSGNDWASLDGLLALSPLADPNLVYTFHFYEPPVLTTLGAFEPGLDPAALGRLPFPAPDRQACLAAAQAGTAGRTRAVIAYYCALGCDTAWVDRRIALAGAWARRYRQAVLLGEFGAAAGLMRGGPRAGRGAGRGAAGAAGSGGALWGYDDSMGFGVLPAGRGQTAAPLDAGVLAALGLDRGASPASASGAAP